MLFIISAVISHFSDSLFLVTDCVSFQSGVSEVIYYVEKRVDNSDATYVASHKLLSMADVKVS